MPSDLKDALRSAGLTNLPATGGGVSPNLVCIGGICDPGCAFGGAQNCLQQCTAGCTSGVCITHTC
jgi:hypothetical protein